MRFSGLQHLAACDCTYPARRYKWHAVPPGTMHRMIISEKVHNALLAEGMVRSEKPGVVLEDLVMNGISPKARTILETIGQDAPSALPTTKAKRLSDDLAAQDRIREL